MNTGLRTWFDKAGPLGQSLAILAVVVALLVLGFLLWRGVRALRGKKATCFMAIKDDVINAGAKYVDEEVVVDGNVITSRKPDDLPAFECRSGDPGASLPRPVALTISEPGRRAASAASLSRASVART